MRWQLLLSLPILALRADAAPVSPPANNTQPISIFARLDKTDFQASEPVDVIVTLQNKSQKAVPLGGSAYELSSFDFNLTRSDGQKVARTAFGQQTLEPPMSCANAFLSLAPGQQRQIIFPLRRMFEMGKSGTFSLSISRIFERYIETKPKQYRVETTTLSVAPLRFSVASPPASSQPPPFPLHGTLLLCLNDISFRTTRNTDGGEVSAYRIRDDGTVVPQLDASRVLSKRGSSFIVDKAGRTVYMAREGAIQAFTLQKGGILQPLGKATPLKPHIFHLARNNGSRLLAFSNWGVQDFTIQADGTLRERPVPPIVPNDYLVWSHDGRFVYATNGSVYAYKVLPNGDFQPLQSRFLLGIGPQEIFLSPNDRTLLCKTSVSATTNAAGETTSWKDVLSLVPINADGTLAARPVFWKNKGKGVSKLLGFNPSGKFALALRDDKLLVFRVEANALTLVSQFAAQFSSYDAVLTFGRDDHVFYLKDRNALRTFRLQEDGQLLSLGSPWGRESGTCSLAVVEAPPRVETFGDASAPTRARLDSEVIATENPVWLDLEVGSQPLSRLQVERLNNGWEFQGSAQKLNYTSVKMLDGGATTLSSLVPNSRIRLDLSRSFDLSLDGTYVLRIVTAQGIKKELRFEVSEPSDSISYDFVQNLSAAQKRAERLDLLRPQSLSSLQTSVTHLSTF